MPLDPEVEALLAAQAGEPAMHTLSPVEARARFEASPQPALPGVGGIEERWIDAGDAPLRVRIYTPRSEKPLPVTVFLHGGGWVIGSLPLSEGSCRRIANDGRCIVVSVDYRLAPEHKFPAAAEDAYAATRWVAESGHEIGADPTRIAVMGQSAGGNLAAAVALMTRDRGGPELRLQVPIYPVLDRDFSRASYLEFADGPGLTRDSMEWFWRLYLRGEDDAKNPYAAPLQADDLSGLAPALVITAEVDPLRDEGRHYAERLREAGVPVTYTEYPGVHHGFFGMPHLLKKAEDAVAQVSTALRGALSPQARAR